MSKVWWTVGMMALLAFPGYALDLGDKAPPLELKTWYHGEAVNPAQPDNKTTYVVEFWATWCPPCRTSIPHLNELQERLEDKNVVIIGITDEPEAKVKPFMKKMKMNYRVALDPDRKAYGTYMKGVPGIPHAFIVDREGKVVWAGHPMSGLDEALDQVIEGRYDLQSTRNRQKIETTLRTLLSEGDLESALKKVEELIKLDPNAYEFYELKTNLMTHLGKDQEISKVHRKMLKRFNDSDEQLNNLAWTLVTAPLESRDLDTAWRAARRANELTEGKNGPILDTLARVYYCMGLLEKAISTQKQALEHCDNEDLKDEVQKVLDYYEAAMELGKNI